MLTGHEFLSHACQHFGGKKREEGREEGGEVKTTPNYPRVCKRRKLPASLGFYQSSPITAPITAPLSFSWDWGPSHGIGGSSHGIGGLMTGPREMRICFQTFLQENIPFKNGYQSKEETKSQTRFLQSLNAAPFLQIQLNTRLRHFSSQHPLTRALWRMFSVISGETSILNPHPSISRDHHQLWKSCIFQSLGTIKHVKKTCIIPFSKVPVLRLCL